jgi:hypothetical protein
MKTDPDGKATIDVIPTGSKVTIQVIADGFATFAEDYQINEASRQILISMIRPKAQVSAYIDNSGKPSEMKPGIQDPIRPTPKPKPATPATPSAPSSTVPSASAAPGTTSAPTTAPTPSTTTPKP